MGFFNTNVQLHNELTLGQRCVSCTKLKLGQWHISCGRLKQLWHTQCSIMCSVTV